LGGCGYTLGYHHVAGVQRLAVPEFRNETFPLRREFGKDLTRSVRQELQIRTDYDVVGSSSEADTILLGSVVSVRERVLSEGPLDRVEESSLTVVVDVELVRIGDGTVLAERRITDNADFTVVGGRPRRTLEERRSRRSPPAWSLHSKSGVAKQFSRRGI
ncbi:MAG: LPS assembly lipoprotein LptE, partial [Planctomycetota bacterium]